MPTITVPPPPLGVDPNSFEWTEWYNVLQRAANNSQTVESITLSTTGFIRGGQTSFNVGTGFFLGYESGAYRFSIGNPSGQYITWDGSSLEVNGTLAPNIVTLSSILDGAVSELKLAAGAVTAAKTNLAAIDDSTGELAANSVSTNSLQALAVTTAKLNAGAVTAEKMTVTELSAITANLGAINAGTIDGVTITGGLFRTATSGRRLEMDNDGIRLTSGNAAAPYGTASATYGTASNTYGSGVLAYINNTSVTDVPFYINEEQSVADFHYYNRSSDPTGPAEIGDIAVVGGKLKICTSAGTPGTWTIVGTQT